MALLGKFFGTATINSPSAATVETLCRNNFTPSPTHTRKHTQAYAEQGIVCAAKSTAIQQMKNNAEKRNFATANKSRNTRSNNKQQAAAAATSERTAATTTSAKAWQNIV